MKHARKIRLTSKDLYSMVVGAIRELFTNDCTKTKLWEYYYATKRGDFIDKVVNEMGPVIPHACLIIYTTNIGLTNNIDHWTSEVRKFLRNMIRKQVAGVKGTQGLQNAVHQAFIKGNFFNIETIMAICKPKFAKEYKRINPAVFESSCQAFLDMLPSLEKLIATFDQTQLDDYANSLQTIKL